MSKFLCMGMSLYDVVKDLDLNAGMALRRPEYGSLKVGSLGDATILTVKEGKFDYVDVARRAPDRQSENRLRRRRAQGQVVAPQAHVEIPESKGLIRCGSSPLDSTIWRDRMVYAECRS